jgi:hypothetical protein
MLLSRWSFASSSVAEQSKAKQKKREYDAGDECDGKTKPTKTQEKKGANIVSFSK